jgi:hypothetical protein
MADRAELIEVALESYPEGIARIANTDSPRNRSIQGFNP